MKIRFKYCEQAATIHEGTTVPHQTISPKSQCQLITYPDSLGGNLASLHKIVVGSFSGCFSGIHILPFYPSSADRGFSPITYDLVDPSFGCWKDIERFAKDFELVADIMVNHISARSTYFRDYLTNGSSSKFAPMFIRPERYWQHGEIPPEDLKKIWSRKPGSPFTQFAIGSDKSTQDIWTTFANPDPTLTPEQIDIDVYHAQTQSILSETLEGLASQGIKTIRLDAVAYVSKRGGTRCFYIEPEIDVFLEWISQVAMRLNLSLLPEVHAHYSIQQKMADQGFWVYDFCLPLLMLHTINTGETSELKHWLSICPRHQYTTLDTHDGIPVNPDLQDLISPQKAQAVVDLCLQRGANVSTVISYQSPEKEKVHQINCTYYSALACNDDAYLMARAIQYFAPGIPQVYYVGLLAGENDVKTYQKTKHGRDINRAYFSEEDVTAACKKPVVSRLLALTRFRNEHPAFTGRFSCKDSTPGTLILNWQNDTTFCILKADVKDKSFVIECQDGIFFDSKDGTP